MNAEADHIRKGFMYNAIEDQDIHEWLNGLPARKHSEYIRKAIRHFMHTEQPQLPQIAQGSGNEYYVSQEEIETIKQRLNAIEAQLAKQSSPSGANTEKNKRNEENRYISAPDILQNLGR